MSTNDVRVAIYRSFVDRGRAPLPHEIAASLGIGVREVESSLEELASDDVLVLLPGTHLVWLAHPFSAATSPFRVTSGDRTWDAICIWDALGILAVAGVDGDVTTACPDCGSPLEVLVRGGEVEAPAEYLVHYGVPAARWYEDVGYT
ncbi:MAG TPA: organomercurial lyase [Actinomycetota bacterium]|nr:organomercurial lyase [Actinomycetota bacterium]